MRTRLFLVLSLFVSTLYAAPKPSIRKYSMVMSGNQAGSETVTVNGKERTVDFEYNDRGRGPKTHTTTTLSATGIPVALHTTGVDYLKSKVDETLATKAGRTHWENGSESGDGDAKAFFVSMYGPPEELGILADALLKNGGRLALSPAGSASIRKGDALTLDANAKRVHVTHYEISGLSFSPADVWLDDNGDLFAVASSWLSTVREGWEKQLKKLNDAQDIASNKRSAELAARLTKRPSVLAITNARVFDPATLEVIPSTTVVVRGGRIEAVGRDIAVPAGAQRIDAAGKTVLPGLWDMHVHLGPDDGMLNIASGVTDVRDLGNDLDYALGLQKQFANGTAIGPNVILAGLIDGSGPYAGPTKFKVDNEDQVKKAIDTFSSHGYVQTKIYSSIKPELVPFIARYSHEKGMRVSGHIPAGMTAAQAVRDGYDEIQHINMLLLNFWPDVKMTQTPLRLTVPAERAATLDLDSPEVKSFIDLLLEHHTVVDPTLSVFENEYLARRGSISPTYAAAADRLPPQVRRGLLAGGLPVPDGMDQRFRDSTAKEFQFVKKLHDAGVTIVAGTDGLAGFTLDRELENYVRAGIPAPEVLRIATLGAATVMHREKDLGSIAPGKIADLVVFDGDPTTNISDVRKPVWVVKNGLLFSSKEVFAAVGVGE